MTRRNPYLPEMIGTFLFAPLVLSLETWRRWGELLSPAALDDWFVFAAAMIVAYRLWRFDQLAPGLWAFVCGGAWFLFCLSLWGSIYHRADGDPSGLPVSAVIAFKAVALALISLAAWRAVRRLRSREPYAQA